MSLFLSPFFNPLQYLIDRSVLKALATLFGIVSRPGRKLSKKPGRVGHPQFLSKQLEGLLIELTKRLGL
jgi:hypothetical protein